nr:uncharacterized protein LOC127339327 [Lolium perenne]
MGILFSCPTDYYDPMEEGILEPSASSGGLGALDSKQVCSYRGRSVSKGHNSTTTTPALSGGDRDLNQDRRHCRHCTRLFPCHGGAARAESSCHGDVHRRQPRARRAQSTRRRRCEATERHEAGSQDEEREEERRLRKAAYIFHGCLYIFYVSLIVEEEVASMWRLGELKWSSTCLYASQHPIKLRNLSCVLSEFLTESRDLCENESTSLKNCQRPLVVGGRVHRAIIMVLGS